MAEYRPTVADVGAILRARTVDADGNELGTFTAGTRPTGPEVDALIDRAMSLLAPVLGDVPDRLAGSARALVALRAAILVERSYFPDQAGDDPGLDALREDLREGLAHYEKGASANEAIRSARVGVVNVGTELAP